MKYSNIVYPPMSFVIYGPFRDLTGISAVTRGMAFALDDLGMNVHLEELKNWHHVPAGLNPEEEYRVNALVQNKIDSKNFVAIYQFPPRLFKNVIGPDANAHIASSIFEADAVPRNWGSLLNLDLFSEVWVPAKFLVNSCEKGGIKKSKTKLIPYGVDLAKFNPSVQPMAIPGRKGFAFTSNMVWSIRKDPTSLLTAYFNEFSDKDDVCLILKAFEGAVTAKTKDIIRNRILDIKKQTKGTAKVIFFGDPMSEDDMPAFIKSGDVYVTASCAEGWGFSETQSMACGIPCIMGKHSAHLDYGTDDNSFWVDSKLEPVTNYELIIEDPQFYQTNWWVTSVASLQKQMRFCYEHRDVVKAKGLRAAEDMKRFSWRNSAIKIIAQLSKFNRY